LASVPSWILWWEVRYKLKNCNRVLGLRYNDFQM
jgi:hypothetical protein